MNLLLAAPAALLALAMLVGCGGTAKTASDASVVARAEAICARKAVHVRPAPPAIDRGPGMAEIVADLDRRARELDALKGPPSLTTGYRRLAGLIVQEASLLRQLDRDSNAGAALAAVRKMRKSPLVKEALRVGLPSCA